MLLRLIVLKKLLVALLLFAVALLSLVGSRRYDQLPDLLQELTESDRTLLAALVSRGLDEGVRRLEVTALVSGLYGLVIAVAALGTLQDRAWGEWLLLMVLLSSLPLELGELIKEPTPVHAILVAVTVVGSVVIGLQVRRRQIRQG
ncbi:MAG: DUF2127 domain-containing protein [Synechococcus sp. MED-G71]|nr:MAG: DUF2127 domain-containing protein [Synechococcus sp. MED-G71]|tara:strand:- start:8073 stop:8510 length:438 start_codon:yes stop_codon:yes gene_type:complete